ncbi:MAG: Pentalenene oxygenase [Myxococcota bacterium]|nr:Pentalenene oxygenase [Myxococcota bacterium]
MATDFPRTIAGLVRGAVPLHGRRLAPMPPPDAAVLGHLPPMRTDPLNFLARMVVTHGDRGIVRLRFGHTIAHLMLDPAYAQHVMQENNKNYTKQTRGFEVIRLILGNGLLTSEGAFWRKQRKIAQPAFHKKRIDSFGEVMVRAALELSENWSRRVSHDPTLDIASEMMRLALRIVGETLLSTDVSKDSDSVGEALNVLLEEANDRIVQILLLPLELPTPRNFRLLKHVNEINSVVDRVIRERRGMANKPNDLLTMLMETRDEETGEGMNDRQLRDEVLTIFLAGHETTATNLGWTFYLLSKHPEVEKRLRQELREVLGGRPPTPADLPNLNYLRMVIQESMRIFPPAWMISRSPTEDDEVGGYFIPKDTFVFVSPYATHRHPKYWPNPEGFMPERFADPKDYELPRFKYFPFGGGPRICIGNGFAMMESQLVLATLLQHWRADLAPGHRVEPAPLITLRPRHGIRMTLSRA